jgi:hypothetical protein
VGRICEERVRAPNLEAVAVGDAVTQMANELQRRRTTEVIVSSEGVAKLK